MTGENAPNINDVIEVIQKLHPELRFGAETVVYSSTQKIEEDPYILEQKVETLSFPRVAVEALIGDAINSDTMVERVTKGHYHYCYDRSDDFKGEFETLAERDSEINVRLTLEMFKGTPIFSYHYPVKDMKP